MKPIDSTSELTASLQVWLETRPNLVSLTANDLSEEYPSLLAMIEKHPSRSLKILGRNDQFDPAAFVDACEAARPASSTTDVLQRIGQAEWDSLWQVF